MLICDDVRGDGPAIPGDLFIYLFSARSFRDAEQPRSALNRRSSPARPEKGCQGLNITIPLSASQANWYRASQYCRYHGMHLASIASQEENDRLEKHIKDFGLGHEHFWTSGTDQAEEGTFFWMANGRPITFENWNVGEPNNFR